ncbi:hypothetical protein B0H14DRAFT_3442684 [Mycena olivaceomarginata]|nr:hypothetical protein B0H14DRAFT_3442684 [Mycena olivaceomarginata]
MSHTLQFDVAPQIFTPRCVYDGRKNVFCIHRLKFDTGSQGSHDNTVLTAITALNVAIRMQPKLSYPFNFRPFFTDRETKDIGPDLDLCKFNIRS